MASRLGVKDYRVEPVDTNTTSGLMSIVLFDNSEPVLVLFTRSTEGVGETVYQVVAQILPRVPNNSTLLYAGSAGAYLLPKNTTLIEDFVKDVLTAHPAQGNATATNTTQS